MRTPLIFAESRYITIRWPDHDSPHRDRREEKEKGKEKKNGITRRGVVQIFHKTNNNSCIRRWKGRDPGSRFRES